MNRPIRGMIYLYTNEDLLIDKSWYASYNHRQRIIDFWFQEYNYVIFICYISVRPKTEEDLSEVSANGIQVKKQPSLQKKEIIHVKPFVFERPKARYDNKKSLYGINYDDL